MLRRLLERVSDEAHHLYWKHKDVIVPVVIFLGVTLFASLVTNTSHHSDFQSDYQQMQTENGYNL